MTKRILGFSLGLMAAANLSALPLLQLDIQGGYYNTVDQSTYATSPVFQLYALADTTSPSWTGFPNDYAISAAIEPKTGPAAPSPSFGSFKINGVTYSVANGNLTYGTPPMSSIFADIPTHSEYPTFYAEKGFYFSTANRMTPYNAQDQPTVDPQSQIATVGTMTYQVFDVDVTGLAPGYSVHFDLYDPKFKNTIFAPFSHDAQSGGGGSVPDGGTTLVLLSGSLALMGYFGRRFKLAA